MLPSPAIHVTETVTGASGGPLSFTPNVAWPFSGTPSVSTLVRIVGGGDSSWCRDNAG